MGEGRKIAVIARDRRHRRDRKTQNLHHGGAQNSQDQKVGSPEGVHLICQGYLRG